MQSPLGREQREQQTTEIGFIQVQQVSKPYSTVWKPVNRFINIVVIRFGPLVADLICAALILKELAR